MPPCLTVRRACRISDENPRIVRQLSSLPSSQESALMQASASVPFPDKHRSKRTGDKPRVRFLSTLSTCGSLCCSVQRDGCDLATMFLMLEWLWKRGSSALRRPKTFGDMGTLPSCAMSGPYLLLYTYLDRRYADTLVLTFAQIEDILGFALPDAARLRREWWTQTAIDAGATRYPTPGSWPTGRRSRIFLPVPSCSHAPAERPRRCSIVHTRAARGDLRSLVKED